MVLVNGADGIGTGWSTNIPNYNPRDIVFNLKRMLDGLEPLKLSPWYKGFKGTIDPVEGGDSYTISGLIAQNEVGCTKNWGSFLFFPNNVAASSFRPSRIIFDKRH